MKHEPNPTPMLADASTHDDVRELLNFARASGPSQADLDRLAKRLSPLVGLSAGDLSTSLSDLGSAPVNPPGFTPGLTVAGKAASKLTLSALGKALVAAGVVSVGAMWWSTTSVPAPRALPSAPKAAVLSPAPQALPAEAIKAPVVEPIPEVVAPAPVVTRRVRPAAPKPVEVQAPAEAPSEIALIKRAEDLRSQPAQVLRTLDEHARLYPTGMLAQEREVLAIEALLASGQRSAAEARADRLAAQHPGSAHLRRVRVLLGAGSAE